MKAPGELTFHIHVKPQADFSKAKSPLFPGPFVSRGNGSTSTCHENNLNSIEACGFQS